jgi:citrate synthase
LSKENEQEAAVQPWRTGITSHDDTHIWFHGHDMTTLMKEASFTDVIFLLHRGRLPSGDERRVIDAILIASADHGPGSPSAAATRTVATGNRAAPEAPIAAGILAIGDAHGGAGLACMQLIARGIDLCEREKITLDAAAQQLVDETIAAGKRLPGMGHRTHSTDPRTDVLFTMMRETKLAGRGIDFIVALQKSAARSIKPLPINVDGAIAAILYDLGFPPVMGKLMFIIGRVAGLSAELVEEYTRERPMRIKIPVVYDGPPPVGAGEKS